MRNIQRCFVWMISSLLFAADEIPDIISQQGAIRIGAGYQSWSSGDNFKVSELSTPVEFYLPFNSKFSLNGYLGYASVQGENISAMYGISDALFAFSWYLENQNLLLNLDFNYPGGKQELTLKEYDASVILSQSFYAFQIPAFGQGFNFSPGFTWAVPVSEVTVLGVGASYQFRGRYIPIEGMSEDNAYDPGDEWLVTTGLDVQTSEMSAFSLDITYTGSGKDRIGEIDMFKAGNKVMAAAQFKAYYRYDLFQFFLRFRSRAKANFYSLDEKIKIQPDELECIGSYRHRINAKAYLGYFLEGRAFYKNQNFEAASQICFGVSPEIKVTEGFVIEGRLKYIIGKYPLVDNSITGIEVGSGMKVLF